MNIRVVQWCKTEGGGVKGRLHRQTHYPLLGELQVKLPERPKDEIKRPAARSLFNIQLHF